MVGMFNALSPYSGAGGRSFHRSTVSVAVYLQLITNEMIDVMSSKLSDAMLSSLSLMFLENMALKRATDVQRCDGKIVDVMKADSHFSAMACYLLAKLATDQARLAHFLRCAQAA